MNVLIVDDEIHCAEGVRCSIDWEALGIEHAFIANSMKQAQSIIRKEEIHIALCDIEMPRGSGLELLEWAQERGYSVISILLTSYQTFQYARKGIELGVIEYLLKPISQKELFASFEKAVSMVRKKSTAEESQKQASFWKRAEKQILKDFWKDMINGDIPLDIARISEQIERRTISFSRDSSFLPILFRVFAGENAAAMEKLFFGLLDNIAANDFIDMEKVVRVHNGNRILMIVESRGDCAELYRRIKEWCDNTVSLYRRDGGNPIGCYLGRFGDSEELVRQYVSLIRRDRNNVTESPKLFADERLNRERIYISPDLTKWREDLDGGLYHELRSDINRYLDGLIQGDGIDGSVLGKLFEDTERTFHDFLHSRRSGDDDYPKDENLRNGARLSVREFRQWSSLMTDYTEGTVRSAISPSSAIEKIKGYVDEHFRQDIGRNQIADFIFMSPDYISRYFKKKTGISLSDYIAKKRMAEAKRLLIETEMYIGEISSTVGYNNLAYFSKVFHKMFKVTPMQYRARFQKRIW